MSAYLRHYWAEAAEYWTRPKVLQPDDISVRARLVQVQELLDNQAARDMERAGLYALHQRLGADPQNLPCYPREQFQVLGWLVLPWSISTYLGRWRCATDSWYILGRR